MTRQQLSDNSDKDTTPGILVEKVERAIHRLKVRKAPGIDNITAEEIKASTDVESRLPTLQYGIKRPFQQNGTTQ